MRLLIIGGTGLISQTFSRYFLDRGDEVTMFNRGRREVDIPPGVKTILGDRTDYAAFERQMAEAGSFDCVIDMICFLPQEAESTIRAFRGRAGQVIFCSTVDVYTKTGNPYPLREDAERKPLPSFPYAYAKAQCEDLFFQAHDRGDFVLTIIRPAYTYGEGGRIIHTFRGETAYIDRLRKGKPIVVHGDGNSLWSCCYIDDVGRAFVEAAGNEKSFGRAYHVAGEEWLTWNRYHQLVAEALGAPQPTLIHIPTDLLGQVVPERAEWCVENFQYNNIFDNKAARTDLNFRYTLPWVEGVRRTVSWLDERNLIDDSDKDPRDDNLIAAWQQLAAAMQAQLAGNPSLT